MKIYLIERIEYLLKELKGGIINVVYGETPEFNYKLNIQDEMFYYSLSFEDLEDVSVKTFFKTNDVCMISLDYDTMDQECVSVTLLEEIKGILEQLYKYFKRLTKLSLFIFVKY